ncbi:MAG: CDP-glycerol glycerophosphotransferase family protein [Clostridia bacterium]|nr:CDP-glycerol glycerophosphotransferase family protein [Clostridia bacterium]
MADKQLAKKIINVFTDIACAFVKRDEKMVVVGGWYGDRFCDNSKAIYLFLTENKEKFGLDRVIWHTRNDDVYNQLKRDGYDVEKIGTRAARKSSIKAKYQLIDSCGVDIDRLFSGSAVRLEMWHAFPVKRFGGLNEFEKGGIKEAVNTNIHRSELGRWSYFYCLSMSQKHSEINQQAFGVNEEHCIIGPYPRVTYLKGEIGRYMLDCEKETMKKLESLRAQGKRVVGYFPTFRDDTEKNDITIETVEKLVEWAKDNNCCIMTKMHYASSREAGGDDDLLIALPPASDVYNFIQLADIMISDYSSIVFDYLIMDRPIIFYCFDYDYYLNKDRGFAIDYDISAAGAKVYNWDELISAINTALEDPRAYTESYADKTERLWNVITDPDTREATPEQLETFWKKLYAKDKTEKLRKIKD